MSSRTNLDGKLEASQCQPLMFLDVSCMLDRSMIYRAKPSDALGTCCSMLPASHRVWLGSSPTCCRPGSQQRAPPETQHPSLHLLNSRLLPKQAGSRRGLLFKRVGLCLDSYANILLVIMA